ncbi:MAG: bifunctional phosphopantothenoylcysteine decarboxylase/phosphopantothenate--cysteine ligase CoaBC [Mariprofundaceae bacterium]
MLKGRVILLVIGGGIAAFRALELARMLMRHGARVRCVPTRAALEFITPLSIEALTGEPAHHALFDLTSEREMGHIRLAREADAIVVAPATADRLARAALGIADDLAGAILLAAECPILFAPAMNASMWRHAATQRHVDALRAQGAAFVGPDDGLLACGEEGPGRLSDLEVILDALRGLLAGHPLDGRRWIVNAGPTWERWDDVRVLTNRASGALGAALAGEAATLGAEVVLVAGPGTPEARGLARRVDVESAEEMLAACVETVREGPSDCFVATAAVSDYRIHRPIAGKHKRGESERLTLELVRNPDIVATIAAHPNRPRRVIAFAAEARHHEAHARRKLAAKGVDAIIANDIGNMGRGHGGFRARWIDARDATPIEAEDKPGLARAIAARIIETEG